MKKLLLLLLLLPALSFADVVDYSKVFPKITEMPGGVDHWFEGDIPKEKKDDCDVYSKTYVYYAESGTVLYDIPRKSTYSVNVRIYSCASRVSADKLFTKYANVGPKKMRKLAPIGEKGVILIQPSEMNPKIGDYYLTYLYKDQVVQIHSDDGFALMDMGDAIFYSLDREIGSDDGIANRLNLKVTASGYKNSSDVIRFTGDGITKLSLSGVVYDDQNNRVPKATVTISETGTSTVTNEKGEYKFTLDYGKGKKIDLIKSLTLPKNKDNKIELITDGVYAIDVTYKNSKNISLDNLKLFFLNDGKIIGSSYNPTSDVKFPISGKMENNVIKITRLCGQTGFAPCRQEFEGVYDKGLFKGSWTGTGGGGSFILYPDRFKEKTIIVKPEEADYLLSQATITDKKVIVNKETGTSGKVSTKDRQYVSLIPIINQHDDFYLTSAKVVFDINVIGSNDSVDLPLYLYAVNDNFTKPTLIGSSKIVNNGGFFVEFDITPQYVNAGFSQYIIGYSEEELIKAQKQKENKGLILSPKFELTYAKPQPRVSTKNAVSAKIINMAGEDVVSNANPIKGDNQPDIVLTLTISAPGGTIKGMEINSKGKSTRKWNTNSTDIYPAIGVKYNGAIINSSDGSINYQLKELTQSFTLYLSKGTLKDSDIQQMTLSVNIDGNMQEIPVQLKK